MENGPNKESFTDNKVRQIRRNAGIITVTSSEWYPGKHADNQRAFLFPRKGKIILH